MLAGSINVWQVNRSIQQIIFTPEFTTRRKWWRICHNCLAQCLQVSPRSKALRNEEVVFNGILRSPDQAWNQWHVAHILAGEITQSTISMCQWIKQRIWSLRERIQFACCWECELFSTWVGGPALRPRMHLHAQCWKHVVVLLQMRPKRLDLSVHLHLLWNMSTTQFYQKQIWSMWETTFQ